LGFSSILLNGKVNIVDAFGRCIQNLKFSTVFKSTGENKTEITQNPFWTKSIWVFGVNVKQITVDT